MFPRPILWSQSLSMYQLYAHLVPATAAQPNAESCDARSSHHFWLKESSTRGGRIWLLDGSWNSQMGTTGREGKSIIQRKNFDQWRIGVQREPEKISSQRTLDLAYLKYSSSKLLLWKHPVRQSKNSFLLQSCACLSSPTPVYLFSLF